VVEREQLLAAGVGRGAIRRGLQAGCLRLLFRSVYAVGHAALSREGWWMAALLACGERSALSHTSAATLWGFLSAETLPVHVTTDSDRGRMQRRIVTHRIPLHSLDYVIRDGLRVTTPARTIVDLAAAQNGRTLRDVVERAQDLRRFDPEDIRTTLARSPRRPGTRELANLMTLMQPDKDKARSHLERLFLKLARAARLPRPEVNQEIAGRERDFAWRAHRLVVEADGYRYHSSKQARARDARRDRELTAHGWRPVRFTYEEIVFEPETVARELSSLLSPTPAAAPRTPARSARPRGGSRRGP
jgi:very-short-patch-repair endonuclease